ncbi:MAG: diaminopropionate ammonia-lyase [Ruminococcaceae bacterium]|nr:diaminopropionate ammonia-lyase [Oscillospiraceae bacterium]
MDKSILLASLTHTHSEKAPAFLSADTLASVRDFHRSLPGYSPTPLAKLPETAALLGLGGIYVKDESHRFGLNAFKALGGSYAIGSLLAQKLGRPMDFSSLTTPDAREFAKTLTFITATDGNHGRGVAWTAAEFGARAVVYMPHGTAKERLDNIRALGADAIITDKNYDDTVRMARADADANGWILVQDTTLDGYEDIPARIMQGYGTIGLEAYEQLPDTPTHIFLQAGVGAMAGAMTGLFASIYGENRPKIVIVEPHRANCIYRTAAANDGKLHFVGGSLDTIMAGLACGEPCSLAWDVLSRHADHFLSCPDHAAAKGMRMLGNPWGGDDRVISGESGAAAFGCAAEIMTNPANAPIRDALELDASSRLLFFSTEGATDRANYRAIVWDGCFSDRE